jgi:hypothetical protein
VRRWQDNIKMDLEELEWEVVNWIHLAPDKGRLRPPTKTIMNLRVP